jgi:hypothetical protein
MLFEFLNYWFIVTASNVHETGVLVFLGVLLLSLTIHLGSPSTLVNITKPPPSGLLSSFILQPLMSPRYDWSVSALRRRYVMYLVNAMNVLELCATARRTLFCRPIQRQNQDFVLELKNLGIIFTLWFLIRTLIGWDAIYLLYSTTD